MSLRTKLLKNGWEGGKDGRTYTIKFVDTGKLKPGEIIPFGPNEKLVTFSTEPPTTTTANCICGAKIKHFSVNGKKVK